MPVNWDEYMKAMEPLDKAIVFGIAEAPSPDADKETKAFATAFAFEEQGPGKVNDATAEFVRAYPHKLVGFLFVHPKDPQCLEEIERCVKGR